MQSPCPKYRVLPLVMIICMIVISGCAVPQPQSIREKDMAELDRIQPRELLEKNKKRLQPGPPPFNEQMAPLTQGISQVPKIYSLVFEGAPLGDVIAAITKDLEYNLSIESEINLSKTVTVNLKNVTLAEALDMILVNGAGYAWTLEKGTLSIKRFAERIYQLDYLDLVGETSIDVGGDMLGAGVENSGVAGKYQIKVKKPAASSDLWIAVEKALGEMKSDDGLLRINRNAGVIYMADTPRKVAAMVRFLDSISESLHRQVFIEARIMEVILKDENKYGIDWTKMNVQFTSDSGAFPDVFQLGFNNGGAIFKGTESWFQALLDFLKTQGDVKVLSNPHLSVMNRQSALMTVGYQFPYTDINGVDRDVETNIVTIGMSIRRAVLGLQLGITPQISGDGIVTFHIVPTLTRIDRQVSIDIPTSGLTMQSISNPVIDLQELATTVRVREGNSFVLAGLINKIRTIDHHRLPILGDLPILGKLFQRIQTSERNSELVILITPYVNESLSIDG